MMRNDSSISPRSANDMTEVNYENIENDGLKYPVTTLRVHPIDNHDNSQSLSFVSLPIPTNYSTQLLKKRSRVYRNLNGSSTQNIDSNESDLAKYELLNLNSEREREIYLRAAFQLLEANNKPTNNNIQSLKDNDDLAITQLVVTNEDPTSLTSSYQRTVRNHSHIRKHNYSNDVQSDVIKYGFLRKVIRHSNSISSTLATPFKSLNLKSSHKSKYVELRFGKFSYENEQVNSMVSLHHPSHNPVKIITLAVDICQCRPVSGSGGCVFELVTSDGSSRLWMTNTEGERNDWVKSIRNAMIGSLDDTFDLGYNLRLSLSLKQLDLSSVKNPSSSANSMSTLTSQTDFNDSEPLSNSSSSTLVMSTVTGSKRPVSCDGPAAQYALEIAKFATVQSAVKLADSPESYCRIIGRMYSNHISITIPVYYVKVMTVTQLMLLLTDNLVINFRFLHRHPTLL